MHYQPELKHIVAIDPSLFVVDKKNLKTRAQGIIQAMLATKPQQQREGPFPFHDQQEEPQNKSDGHHTGNASYGATTTT